MKTSIQSRNGVSSQMVDVVARLVDLIPWPIRRSAMGDFIWKKVRSVVRLLDTTDEKGVKIGGKEKPAIAHLSGL